MSLAPGTHIPSCPPGERRLLSTVHAPRSGTPALAYCLARWPTYPQRDWLDAFAEGRIRVNDQPATVDCILVEGDMLSCTVPSRLEPDVCREYRTIYRDDVLLVVDKPGNLPCHPAGRYQRNTLESLLIENEGLAPIHMVNRLDRETSGLVLIALTPDSASRLGALFMRHEVVKTYLVAVEGEFPSDPVSGTGWLYLATGVEVRRKRVFVPSGSAHPSDAQTVHTEFRRIVFQEGISWIEALPRTGRPHQIRATLKGLGFPVVGDKLYGVDERLYAKLATDSLNVRDWERLRLPRQALHASQLELVHPYTGERLCWTSPLPSDLQKLYP